MRRIVLILAALLFGVCVNAQRPLGDTVFFKNNGDYIYDSFSYQNPAYHRLFTPGSTEIDPLFHTYKSVVLRWMLWPGGQTTMEEFWNLYPDMAVWNAGRHSVGQGIATPNEDLMIIGLAVCPVVLKEAEDLTELLCMPYSNNYLNYVHAIDTTTAGRLTEYVQLYTIEGGVPQFKAESPWRIENPHRYMCFPDRFDYLNTPLTVIHEPIFVPLYEAMFDTGVYIEANKSPIMVAGTHNNNRAVWSTVACDTVYSTPTICYEHSLTAYSAVFDTLLTNTYGSPSRLWIRYDTLPWYDMSSYVRVVSMINIFPILDTLFGTPCAVVTDLQTVEVDSLWATLMWSADARHQEWEVKYRPTEDSLASDSVVTVNVPTVTLTGLTPGTTYSVRVRGLCDACVENYSPWSDTLQFVTTFTPPDTTPDTVPWVRPHTLDPLGIGNLMRFTRMMPNPAHDVVSVFSSYQLQGVTVYDLAGRQLLNQSADGMTATVNVAALPRGTYILAIRTLQGVATKRLILK